MLAVFKKEMRSYFTGAIGYVFLVLYLAVGGIVFCYTTLYSMSASVTPFFTYMLLFSGIILPILTMKSFSEERKIKTEQLLMTAPIRISSMVLGKLLAAYVMFAGCMIITSLYFVILTEYAVVNFALWFGNLVAILLVGLVFISVGVFVSSLGFADITVSAATAGDLSEDEYLLNKNPEMVELYATIRDMVKSQISNLTTYTTNSKAYIGLSSVDNKKKNFAEFAIKRDSLSLEIEKPDDAVLQALGEDIPYNGSHDHYFGISVTAESDLDKVVAAIVASYEKLK